MVAGLGATGSCRDGGGAPVSAAVCAAVCTPCPARRAGWRSASALHYFFAAITRVRGRRSIERTTPGGCRSTGGGRRRRRFAFLATGPPSHCCHADPCTHTTPRHAVHPARPARECVCPFVTAGTSVAKVHIHMEVHLHTGAARVNPGRLMPGSWASPNVGSVGQHGADGPENRGKRNSRRSRCSSIHGDQRWRALPRG